jgi:hypothetical protein
LRKHRAVHFANRGRKAERKKEVETMILKYWEPDQPEETQTTSLEQTEEGLLNMGNGVWVFVSGVDAVDSRPMSKLKDDGAIYGARVVCRKKGEAGGNYPLCWREVLFCCPMRARP